MRWLKKAILGAALGVVGVSVSAQEPARPNAVRLGTPVPLGEWAIVQASNAAGPHRAGRGAGDRR